MRWSKNPRTGAWYTYSTDEESIYVATKLVLGMWEIAVIVRRAGAIDPDFPKREDLGLVGTLVQAKRVADRHHHAHIREHGTAETKRYIMRFPV